MITLDPHDGDLGMSAWVDCHKCQRSHALLGWFGIRGGDRHWVDREHNHHFHHDCGLKLVDAGRAVMRDIPVKAAS
jgi:hypothetical protein